MLFTRILGQALIDTENFRIGKIEGHVTEDITLRCFLAKVYRGSTSCRVYEMAPECGLSELSGSTICDGRKSCVPFSIHERNVFIHITASGAAERGGGKVWRGRTEQLGENQADSINRY